MPNVAGLIGPTLSFYGNLFYKSMSAHYSDLSLNITSLANPTLNSQARPVFPITFSRSILYFVFLVLFLICNPLGNNLTYLFYKQSSLKIGTISFLLSLSFLVSSTVSSIEQALTIYLLSEWLTCLCPSVSYFKKIFRSWKIQFWAQK